MRQGHPDWLASSYPRSGDGNLTHKSKARRPKGPVESEGQMLHLLMVAQCAILGRALLKSVGPLGYSVSTRTGETGFEPCVSKLAICSACRHQKSVLRISGCRGYLQKRNNPARGLCNA